jgi:hypothetical protein
MSNLSNTYTDDNNTDYSKLILKAFTDRKPEIASFIGSHTKTNIDIDKLDRYDRNIIHYLVIFYGYESLRNLLNSIIEKTSPDKLKKNLNVQDKMGNTPLHYAMMFNFNELIQLLINNGANPSLKNKEGDSIYEKQKNNKDNKDNKENKENKENSCDDEEIIINGENIEDEEDGEDEDNSNNNLQRNSFMILLKSKPAENISDMNSVSNLDELSMSDIFMRKNNDSNIVINDTDARRNNLSAQEINSALEKIVKAFAQPSQNSQNSQNSDTFKFDRNTLSSVKPNTQNTPNTIDSISALKHIKSEMNNNKDEVDTDNFAMAILDKLKLSNRKTQTQTDDDDDIPEDSWRVKQIPELVVGPRAGEPYALSMNSMNNDPTTDMMINKLRNPQQVNPQQVNQKQYKSELVGGKKNKKSKIVGKRKIHTFSELSYGELSDNFKRKNLFSENALGDPIKTDDDLEEANNKITAELFEDKEDKDKKNKKDKKEKDSDEDSEDKLDKKLTSELSEMARNIARQSTDIHERTIEKIATILKLDLKNPEDNKKARYFKAAIWRMVKEEHPELSNYDRSVEMEKNVTVEKLKSIDIEKVSKDIDKYFSEKSTSQKETKSDETITPNKEKKVKKVEKKTEEKKEKKETKADSKKDSKKKLLKRIEESNNTLSISTET